MSGKKPVYNASDEKTVADKAEREELNQKQQLEDIKTLASIPAGVRFFRQLLADGHVFTTSFTGNSTTFFLEGHRNLALQVFGKICEAAPQIVAELVVKTEDKEIDYNG